MVKLRDNERGKEGGGTEEKENGGKGLSNDLQGLPNVRNGLTKWT